MPTQATSISRWPAPYDVANLDEIFSPGLIIYRELLESNLREMVRLAGEPTALRPHVKTHKLREIVRMWLNLGVERHKCATIAEAEMLAREGAADVLLAYQLVGPNLGRWVQLVRQFPETRFSSLVDQLSAAESLSAVAQREHLVLNVLLDLNSGMNRTGSELGSAAEELYEIMASSSGLRADGLHWYDGHHRQADREERRRAVLSGWEQCLAFRDRLCMSGLPVPRIVAAGTGSFPILAECGEPHLELSPGTTVFFDAETQERFPELPFRPALGILTRVISRDGFKRLTLDVGHKACAADPPAGRRLWFPQLPAATEIQHSEEHLVIESIDAGQWSLGDPILAIPQHACPTAAVYQFADVVSSGAVRDRWEIVARNRVLTI